MRHPVLQDHLVSYIRYEVVLEHWMSHSIMLIPPSPTGTCTATASMHSLDACADAGFKVMKRTEAGAPCVLPLACLGMLLSSGRVQ
mmetsp:Transcript_50293/g.130909  ORF Transcript_50293/g.130909 Transcript_50293/m.130909 type:complete len:86 (+) Transcript_50293:529-786(+)